MFDISCLISSDIEREREREGGEEGEDASRGGITPKGSAGSKVAE